MSGFSGHGFKFGPLIGLELARAIAGESAPPALSAWAAGALDVLERSPVARGGIR
jgi:glycine/D-amino acid oxidase-like deaminating enzyme